jgi:hypothetical protein
VPGGQQMTYTQSSFKRNEEAASSHSIARFLFGVSVFLERKLAEIRPAACGPHGKDDAAVDASPPTIGRGHARGTCMVLCTVDLPPHQQCPLVGQSVLY